MARPTTAAVTMAIATPLASTAVSAALISFLLNRSVVAKPPIEAGMYARYDRRKASFGSTPMKSIAETVIPERETPGRAAMPWATPTAR